MLLHNLLPRVLTRAWDEESEEDADDDQEESFRAVANKQRRAALEFVREVSSATTLGISLVACMPLDRLSFRLQHLDHAGSSLLELVDDSVKGPLMQCQHHLWEVLNPWHGTGSSNQLESVWWHLEGLGADMSSVYDDSRAT